MMYIPCLQYKGNTFFPIMKSLHGKTRNWGTFVRDSGTLLIFILKRSP